MNTFLKTYSDLVSLAPTSSIVLMNVGFTGSQGSVDPDLFSEFLTFIKYKKSYMPHRPFCFIEFENIKDSETAVEFIRQRSFFNRVVDLEYVVTIPMFDHNVLVDKEIQSLAGLHYIPDFITNAEEEELLSHIESIDTWIPLSHRRVKHYGYSYDYVNEGSSKKVEPFPDWISTVLYRLQVKFPDLNQLTINFYEPGDGIGPHSDSRLIFGIDPIVVVSLSSAIVMDFIKDSDRKSMDVGRKSLLVMSGDARLDWKHGIRNRKIDYVNGVLRKRGTRISLTFRKVDASSISP